MSNTSKIISFDTLSGSSSNDSEISLDEDYNSSVYKLEDDDTKTIFDPDEIVYLKIIPGAKIRSYTLGSSSGVLSVANLNIIYNYEEDINFEVSNTEELHFIPYGSVSYKWIGNNGGIPLFVDGIITIPEKVIGILRCSYTVMGDRLKLSNTDVGDSEYPVLCLAIYGADDNASTTVNFETEEIATSVFLKIQVVDMCTGDPIPNANVIIDGVDYGLANEDGIVSLPEEVLTGTSYDIRVIADGYVSSDLDFIKNDSFTIPIVVEEE